MARLTCSVRVVQLRIESRFWMEKLEDQLMSASGKLQRGMRWPVKVRKGPSSLAKADSTPSRELGLAARRLRAKRTGSFRYHAFPETAARAILLAPCASQP